MPPAHNVSRECVRYRISDFSFDLAGPCDNSSMAMLRQNFALLESAQRAADITIKIQEQASGFCLIVDERAVAIAVSDSELIYEVEGLVVVNAQLMQPDYVYLHAAAIVANGIGVLLVGESGAGKSTLCWALCDSGCQYLSDELAPLSCGPEGFSVHPYPHALCLKKLPPGSLSLPKDAFFTGRTWHIPMAKHAKAVDNVATPIQHICIIDRAAPVSQCLVPLTKAELAHQLYPHMLNALAHPNHGLDAAADIAHSISGFTLNSSDIENSCRLLDSLTRYGTFER